MADTYHGKPCQYCGNTLRYLSRHCVQCKNKDWQKKMETGTYMGGPCHRGHDGRRYKSDRGCVECRRITRKSSGRASVDVSALAGIFVRQARVAGLAEWHAERAD
jgi:hypothetical protein